MNHRTLLVSIALLCTIAPVAAQPATRRAAWQTELPFAPQVAVARDGVLRIARLVDGNVSVSTATLSLNGVGIRPEETVWGDESFAAPIAADTLLAIEGRWALYDSTTRDFALVKADDPSEAATGVLPLDRLDALEIADGHLFALGGRKPETLVASISLEDLAAGGKWVVNPPVAEPRYGAALVETSKELFVIGGDYDHPAGGVMKPAEIYAAGYGTDGHLSFWEPSTAMKSFTGFGTVSGMNLNDLVVLLPRDQEGDSLRLHTIMGRGDGTFTLPKELAPGTPPVSGAFVAPYAEEHLALVVGGTMPDGSEATTLYAWRMVETNEFMRIQNKRARAAAAATAPGRYANRERPRFKAGLGRASERNMHHVVLILDDGEESDQFLRRVLDRHNVKMMLKDVIVSQAWPEELEDVRKIAGTEEVPAMMFLDPGGQKLGVLSGMPTDQEIFDLLKTIWAPVYDAPAPAEGLSPND